MSFVSELRWNVSHFWYGFDQKFIHIDEHTTFILAGLLYAMRYLAMKPGAKRKSNSHSTKPNTMTLIQHESIVPIKQYTIFFGFGCLFALFGVSTLRIRIDVSSIESSLFLIQLGHGKCACVCICQPDSSPREHSIYSVSMCECMELAVA